jgi:hypothetical protein
VKRTTHPVCDLENSPGVLPKNLLVSFLMPIFASTFKPFGLLVELARVFWNSFLDIRGLCLPVEPRWRLSGLWLSNVGTWQGIAPCDSQARFNRYRSLTKSSKSRFE